MLLSGVVNNLQNFQNHVTKAGLIFHDIRLQSVSNLIDYSIQYLNLGASVIRYTYYDTDTHWLEIDVEFNGTTDFSSVYLSVCVSTYSDKPTQTALKIYRHQSDCYYTRPWTSRFQNYLCGSPA